jgi:hypothetical protein
MLTRHTTCFPYPGMDTRRCKTQRCSGGSTKRTKKRTQIGTSRGVLKIITGWCDVGEGTINSVSCAMYKWPDSRSLYDVNTDSQSVGDPQSLSVGYLLCV